MWGPEERPLPPLHTPQSHVNAMPSLRSTQQACRLGVCRLGGLYAKGALRKSGTQGEFLC